MHLFRTKMRTAFLIIDAQYDFCNPEGALFVPGAVEDMNKLSRLINKNASNIDHIIVTLDNHPVNDISHPGFWKDKNGIHPAPFTQVTSRDIEAGNWLPQFKHVEALTYLKALEAQGKFLHFIWPEHCLIGSKGASLDDTLLETLRNWTRSGRQYQAVVKGQNPLTEHFGIFQAQIPIDNALETQLNTSLIEELKLYDNIYLAGEAKSHCVATSLKQAMDYAPELARKIILIEDCMSDVPGLGHLGTPIFNEAREKGLRFVQSEDLNI